MSGMRRRGGDSLCVVQPGCNNDRLAQVSTSTSSSCAVGQLQHAHYAIGDWLQHVCLCR